MGWFAHAKDTEGNSFSMWQNDENAAGCAGRESREAAQDRKLELSSRRPRIAFATRSPDASPSTFLQAPSTPEAQTRSRPGIKPTSAGRQARFRRSRTSGA